jgi:crotonobetainyl-CoA:carnitine CoA-transferase CaiB-like acyl-CoA transferase
MAEWIAETTGVDSVLDEAFNDMRIRWEVSEFIDDLTEQVTRPGTKLELFIEGQKRGIPITPVNTVADLRNDPHLRSAGFWHTDHHEVFGELSGPGAPFRVNHDWWRWARAPRLGEHNAALLGHP